MQQERGVPCLAHARTNSRNWCSASPSLLTASAALLCVHSLLRYHQYKFIVDGKWRHDETAPFMPDPLGNVNNWLFVRRIDPGLR